jgi:methylated-DNA-protein-cysteine methyltransferase related protein
LITIKAVAKTKAKRVQDGPGENVLNIRAAIMKIPRGKVSSYGAIARAAGLPGGARLVVRVLNQSHGLPWHRVVAAGGRIALPGEHGFDQRFRLEMEGVKFSGRKVRMAEFEHKFVQQSAKQKSAKKKSTKKKSAKKERNKKT